MYITLQIGYFHLGLGSWQSSPSMGHKQLLAFRLWLSLGMCKTQSSGSQNENGVPGTQPIVRFQGLGS